MSIFMKGDVIVSQRLPAQNPALIEAGSKRGI
jgi:hypothetical protein